MGEHKQINHFEINVAANVYCILLLHFINSNHNRDRTSQIRVLLHQMFEINYEATKFITLIKEEREEFTLLFTGKDKEAVYTYIKDFIQRLEKIPIPTPYCGGIGECVESFAQLEYSYEKAKYACLAYYIEDYTGILTYAEFIDHHADLIDLSNMDSEKLHQKNKLVVQNYLKYGKQKDICCFVEAWIHYIGKSNMEAKIVRQYLVSDVYFSALGYLEELGMTKEEAYKLCGDIETILYISSVMERIQTYITRILLNCMQKVKEIRKD